METIVTKSYQGAQTRLLLPKVKDVAGVIGDNNATRLCFKLPKTYATGWQKFVEFDCYVVRDGEEVKPTYVLDENNSILIPYEITESNVGKEVDYNLKLVSQDGEVVEKSEIGTLYFRDSSNGTFVDPDPYTDVVTFLYNNAFCNVSYSDGTSEGDDQLPKLTFTPMNSEGEAEEVSLNIPYLDEDGYILNKFINKEIVVEIFRISDPRDLVGLTDAQVPDMALLSEGDSSESWYMDLYMLVGADPTQESNWYLIHTDNPTFENISANGDVDIAGTLSVGEDVTVGPTHTLKVDKIQSSSTGDIPVTVNDDLTIGTGLQNKNLKVFGTTNLRNTNIGDQNNASTTNIYGDVSLLNKDGSKVLVTDANKKIAETIGTQHQVLVTGENGPEWSSPSGPAEGGQGVASTGALYSEYVRATSAEEALDGRVDVLEEDTINTAGTYLTKSQRTLSHNSTARTDTESNVTITNGGSFSAIDSVSDDNNDCGHLTGVNTKTVTLPTITAGTGTTIGDASTSAPKINHKYSANAPTSDANATLSNGGNFTMISELTRDEDNTGHVTTYKTKKITLPTYAAGDGIKIDSDGLTFKHTNSAPQETDATASESSANVQVYTYDGQGHFTSSTLKKIQIAEAQVTDLVSDLAGKAPNNHASSGTTYGVGEASKYGHVRFDELVNPNRASDSDKIAISERGIINFVNSSVEAVAAYYITDSQGLPWATKAALMATQASDLYSGGVQRTPTRNDYTIVSSDESHETYDLYDGYVNFDTTSDYIGHYIKNSGTPVTYTLVTSSNMDSLGIVAGTTEAYERIVPSTRYIYNSDSATYSPNNWNFQYTFNQQYTQAQMSALNSGITATKVDKLDGLPQYAPSIPAADSDIGRDRWPIKIVDGVPQEVAYELVTTASTEQTIAGHKIFTGATDIKNVLTVGSQTVNGSIELYHATPFIDFHYNRSTSDYTTRIIESSAGVLSLGTTNGTNSANLTLFGNQSTAHLRGSYRATPSDASEILTLGNGVSLTTAQTVTGRKTYTYNPLKTAFALADNSNKWYKLASLDIANGDSNTDYNGTFYIRYMTSLPSVPSDLRQGILSMGIRVSTGGATPTIVADRCNARWILLAGGLAPDELKVGYKGTLVEIWVNIPGNSRSIQASLLSEGTRTGNTTYPWVMYNTQPADGVTTLDNTYTWITPNIPTTYTPDITSTGKEIINAEWVRSTEVDSTTNQSKNGLVHNTGNETINGVKTFTGLRTSISSGESALTMLDTRYARSENVTSANINNFIVFTDKDVQRVALVGYSRKKGVDGIYKTDTGMTNFYDGSHYGALIIHTDYDSNNSTYSNYTTSPNRSYASAGNSDVLTKAHLESAITIGGQKTFANTPIITSHALVLKDNSHAIDFSNTTYTNFGDITFQDSAGDIFAQYRVDNLQDNSRRLFSLVQRKVSGTTYQNRISQVISLTGDAYVTAPCRPYSSAGNDDVLVKRQVADMMTANVSNHPVKIYSAQNNLISTTTLNQFVDQDITLPASSVQYQNVTFGGSSPTTGTTAFTLQSTPDYANYPYRASYALAGVTADTYVSVTFSDAQVDSGNFASFAKTVDGYVYLYANADVGATTVPTISLGMDDTAASGLATSALDGKVNKLTTSGNYAYTHSGSTQSEVSITASTTGSTLMSRDANGRTNVANPPSGDTGTYVPNTNWISQTGDSSPNNLVHRTGNETINGIKTFGQGIIAYPEGWHPCATTTPQNKWGIFAKIICSSIGAYHIFEFTQSSNTATAYGRLMVHEQANAPSPVWLERAGQGANNPLSNSNDIVVLSDGTDLYLAWKCIPPYGRLVCRESFGMSYSAVRSINYNVTYYTNEQATILDNLNGYTVYEPLDYAVNVSNNQTISGTKTFTPGNSPVNINRTGNGPTISQKALSYDVTSHSTTQYLPSPFGLYDTNDNLYCMMRVVHQVSGRVSVYMRVRNADGTTKDVLIAEGDA